MILAMWPDGTTWTIQTTPSILGRKSSYIRHLVKTSPAAQLQQVRPQRLRQAPPTTHLPIHRIIQPIGSGRHRARLSASIRRKKGKNGIEIAGESGTPISVSADGRVVYAGTGLIGFGRIIIVKHSEQYISVYAHNSRLVVNEGDNVVQGQKIAEMGQTDTDRVKLHFEIRRNGKPVDPLQLLPKG